MDVVGLVVVAEKGRGGSDSSDLRWPSVRTYWKGGEMSRKTWDGEESRTSGGSERRSNFQPRDADEGRRDKQREKDRGGRDAGGSERCSNCWRRGGHSDVLKNSHNLA
ncbi:hypothetical protein SEVIR_8G106425v4 [Setaria viridis]